MGEVWRARDTRLGREVALKVLPDAFADDRERTVRFQREAQLLATFNHPNIAAIHSFERVEGVQLLVMEMVPGETLRQLVEAGPLPLSRALGIARQVADALDAAHGKGILHRDLKPANVKVTPDGKVKLLDFGLAKAFAPGPNVSDLSESPTLDTGATRQGMVLGTAAYMSPEQARGKPLDWRSDVWSFGCLLYEMLAGKKAFSGDSPSDVLVAILDREPDWTALPVATPPGILDLLSGCLTKSRDDRTPDLAHARQVIDAVLTGRTTLVPQHLSGVSARIRRAPRAWAAAGALLAVSVAALLYFTLRGKDTTALPASKLLAILPATDLTGREDGRQLCDGVSFSLGVKLQSVPGVAIMPPSAPALLKETDPAKWARDTGANLLVQPAVRQMGDTRQLSFSVSLAGSPVQIAAGEVTGPAADHFRLENELTQKIMAALQIHLASRGPVPTPSSPELTPGPAQTDYVVALGCLERYDDTDSVKKAIHLLTGLPGGGNSALIQAALGRAHLASYRLSKDVSAASLATEAAQRAIALSPGLPEAQVTLGEVLTVTGRPAEAVPVLRTVLESDPGSVPALLALVTALQRSGDMDGAEKAALRLVEIRPTSPTAVNRLGAIYFRTSRYEKAAAAFERAIALNPDLPRAHFNLGAAFLRLGRFGDAEKALQSSIRIEPIPQAFSNLGVAQYLLGRFAEAAASFQRAVDLAPKNYRWRLYLGDALSQLPDRASEARRAYEEALPLVRAELSVDPTDAPTIVLFGRCLARTGEPERAWSEIRRGVALAPSDEGVLELAAAAAMVLGKKAEALVWLEQAVARGYGLVEIQRDPDFAPLRGDSAFQKLASLTPTPTSLPQSTGGKR